LRQRRSRSCAVCAGRCIAACVSIAIERQRLGPLSTISPSWATRQSTWVLSCSEERRLSAD